MSNESVLVFGSNAVYHVIFIIYIIIMIGLTYFSVICVIRQRTCNDKMKQFNHIRYLTLLTVLTQFLTFIGYYAQLPGLHQSLWNIWIPTFAIYIIYFNIDIYFKMECSKYIYRWTIAFGLLSHKIATIYVNTQTLFVTQYNETKRRLTATLTPNNNPTPNNITSDSKIEIASMSSISEDTPVSIQSHLSSTSLISNISTSLRDLVDKWNSKYRAIFFKCIWILWALCSVLNWLGSLFGWVLKLEIEQAICYALWKLTAFIMLIGCISILFIVKKRCNIVLIKKNHDDYINKETTKRLRNGLTKIKYLMICELVLGLVLFMAVVYEFWVIHALVTNKHIGNNIYTQSTIISMLVYFPIWTMVSMVLVVYSWIPKTSLT